MNLAGSSPLAPHCGLAMSTPVRRLDGESSSNMGASTTPGSTLTTPQPPTSREHLTPKKYLNNAQSASPRTPPSFKKVFADLKRHAVREFPIISFIIFVSRVPLTSPHFHSLHSMFFKPYYASLLQTPTRLNDVTEIIKKEQDLTYNNYDTDSSNLLSNGQNVSIITMKVFGCCCQTIT